MGLPSKAASASNICLKDKNEIVFSNTKNCSIFKSLFSNLAQNLVSKLLPSPNVFTESKVASYYDNIEFKNLNFEFCERSPEKTLNTLKGLNPSKAAGIDNLSGKLIFLTNSIRSLEVVKLQKSNCFLKKAPEMTLKTTAPFHYSPSY